jgi:hypothetical protein
MGDLEASARRSGSSETDESLLAHQWGIGGGPALYRAAEAAPALRPTDFGHLQNFQRLRAPLRARLRSPRATLAETARIRHLIEINRALGADVRAVRPHNLLPNCLDRCSFCAPCLSSCQQIRATRLRHPRCGQATVAAAKKAPLHAGPRN